MYFTYLCLVFFCSFKSNSGKWSYVQIIHKQLYSLISIDQSELTFQDWKSISDTLNRLIQVCRRFRWTSEKLQNAFCKKKVGKRLNAINSWIYWHSKILETQRDIFAVFVWLDRTNKIIICGLFSAFSQLKIRIIYKKLL